MKRILTFVALCLGMSCNEPPTTTTGTTDPVEIQLLMISGDGQEGPAFEELPTPVVVRVLNERNGQGIRNQTVNFRVVEGGGSVFAGVAQTDNDGIAQEFWTLGAPGPQRLEARAVSADGEKQVFGVFTATAMPLPPQTPTRFTDLQSFLTASGAIETVSFPTTRGLTTTPYVENGVTLVSAGGFNNVVLDETTNLAGNEFTVSGAENIDITFPPGVLSVGVVMEDGVAGGGCTGRDSQFQLTFIASDMQTVLGTFEEDPPIGQSFFIGFLLGASVGRLEIREVGSNVNDLFDPFCENDWIGSVYTGTTPPR